MKESFPELLSMLMTSAVEIKKEHQMLMVDKTTSFKKKGKSKGNFKKDDKSVAGPEKKTKGGPKPDAECNHYKGSGHWKRNCPKYLVDKKDGKVKKVYVIY